MATLQTGAELIAAERQRQIEKEGYSALHDDTHEQEGQLALAAAAYATPAIDTRNGFKQDMAHFRRHYWPWGEGYFKPSPDDRVRELVKAGALLAAEIDRLHRRPTATPVPPAAGASAEAGV